MHEKHYCHRDLKPDNIIYQKDCQKIKIIDFGFAISCKDKLKFFCGTPAYMAPEIVNKKEYSGSAADIWACGVILYQLLTGVLPFRSNDEKGLFKKIDKATYPTPFNAKDEKSTAEARHLIR